MGSSGTYKAIVKVTGKGTSNITKFLFEYPNDHDLLSYKVSPKNKGSDGNVDVNKTSHTITWNPATRMMEKSRTFQVR
jgi:hypothetical protein